MLRQLFDCESSTYTYLVVDDSTRLAALIDPVREQIDRDLGLIAELGVRLTHVFDTHMHADHVTAAGLIRDLTGARTYASEKGAPCVDVRLHHGDLVELGDTMLQALATPGHTDDSMCIHKPGAVFTGDTLFVRGCGRTDFQNGDARALYASITDVLFSLPDATVVYPGHDYRGFTSSTIGEERRFNPRIANRNVDEFARLMSELRLPPPRRLAEAVPANRACGVAEQ